MNIVQAQSAEGMERDAHGILRYTAKRSSWSWSSLGALFGLFGGVAVALIGSALTAISWITDAAGTGAYLHTLGTDFLILTIPLIVLGAHCLDVEETRKKL